MIRRWLSHSGPVVFVIYAMTAAFGTYFCMYAFRKPFTVATFDNLAVWGIDFKILIIISQVLGYALSKFAGIKVISEMGRNRRLWLLLILIGAAELALLLFAIVPYPFNFVCLFLNGIPLGMIWGVVFSYLEGRKFSEILGAGLSASFIVSSGAVKSVGKIVLDSWSFSEFWMPFITGLIFLPPFILFAWLLEQVPPPGPEDELLRTKRLPMGAGDRRRFFSRFSWGLVALILLYMALTAYRDFRDNFAAELWSSLGFGSQPGIFTLAEIPIAFAVLIILGLTMLIKNNRKAFIAYHWMILGSVLLVGCSTFLFGQDMLHPAVWMILVGMGLYMAYVPFNCILFDRMMAAFRYKGNAGFMIYVADAFGYLGSVFILLFKNFGQPSVSWLGFFIKTSYALALAGLLFTVFALVYFKRKMKAGEETAPEEDTLIITPQPT